MMFVTNFKILGQAVPEKLLTKIKVNRQTDRQRDSLTEKAKTIYPLYTSYTGGIIIFQLSHQSCTTICSCDVLTGKATVLDSRLSRHLLAYDGHRVG